jgi:hypothetical protein
VNPRSTADSIAIWGALAGVAAVSVLLGYRPVYSFDVGFYLQIGRQIADTGRIPFQDNLTFTRAGTEVLHYPWLFNLVSWWLYELGGTLALVLTRIAGYLACFGGLLYVSWRRLGRMALPPVLLILFFSLGSFWEYRPHVASWLCLLGVLICLEEYERGHSRALWCLPAILALWVNLHSLFVLGLIVIGLFWVARTLRSRSIDRTLLLWGGVSGLACFLTPYFATVARFPLLQFGILRGGLVTSEQVGTAEFLSPFRLGFYEASGGMVWWQPILFVHLYVVLVVVAAWFGRRRYRLVDWLLLISFGYVFSQALKNHGYFVLATLPAASLGLADLGASLHGTVERRIGSRISCRLTTAGAASLLALCLVVGLQVLSGYWYARRDSPHRLGHEFNERVLPLRAAEYLATHFDRPRRVLNNWDCGGYLGFATGWPVFIDGRNEIMGERFYREYLRFKDPARLPALLDRAGIEVALVPAADLPQWFGYFRYARDWRWVYRDERHSVFVRESVEPDLPRLPRPVAGVDYRLFSAAEADEILRTAESRGRPSLLASLHGRHDAALNELAWSLLYLRAGYPDAAIGQGLAGLRSATVPVPQLLVVLGHAYFDRGDLVRAARCFGRALERIDDPLARKRLERIRSSPAARGAVRRVSRDRAS